MAVPARDHMPMGRTGFCEWASPGAHYWCNDQNLSSGCECHENFEAFDDGTRPGDPLPLLGTSEATEPE